MAKQLSMLEEPAVAREDEDSTAFTVTEVIRRRNAYDDWHTAYLRRFYNERREAIMLSGDSYRIDNLQAHDDRERNRQ